jgi:hypothetical protein
MTLIEKIDTSRYEYPTPTVWSDDGYEFMDKAHKHAGWRIVGSWGRDGWDLGSWPLVIVQHRELGEHTDTFDVLYYVEGDITIERYPTREERDARTDELAVFHWLCEGERWVKDLGIDQNNIDLTKVPAYLRGPYSTERSGDA